jgi:poly-gamma-glutamate synthesis protein (capsule biosynthesis protein)
VYEIGCIQAGYRHRRRSATIAVTIPTTLFLCGDVMLGRGIDQILPHPGDPRLYESYVKSAATYVELAERRNGPIPKPVDFEYVWGDVLAELQRVRPVLSGFGAS